MADREPGELVREKWLEWARRQPDPKPSWLVPWKDLDKGQREVDAEIEAAVRADEGRLLEDVQAEAVLRRIAERQRFVLVWRDERAAEICRSAPVALGTARIAIPLDAQHADLTGGDGD